MVKLNRGSQLTVAILCAVMALISGFFIAQHIHLKKKMDVSQFHGTLLETPRPISHFSLTGTDRQPFNNASLRGHWTLMFFGFTHCGYMCPTIMAELGKTYRLLIQEKASVLPNVVMVTLDPEHDDLDRLNHYVRAFDSHFYGARGSHDSIDAMTHELGIAYAKVVSKNQSSQDNIEHTGVILLFNPEGHLVSFFTMPHQAQLLAHDYMLLIA